MAKPTQRRVIVSPLTNTVQGKIAGRKGMGKHLEPGVVKYDNDDGTSITYLLPLAAIEKMRPTAAGKPVVGKSGGFDHVKVEQGKQYDGEAIDSFWDGESGWEAFNFDKMNDETARACEKGFQISCAYIPTDVDETPGKWHNVDYDAVILDAEYTHFAVVPNPRYEGATIELFNSTGGGIMNKVLRAALSLVPFAQLKEVVNSIEKEEAAKKELTEKRNSAIGAAKTAFDEAMKNAKTDEEKAAAKSAFEKANAEAEAMPVEPKADLPKEPIGGGDVPPEPGMPGLTPQKPTVPANAAPPTPPETPEQAQEREKLALEKKNAEDAAAKKAADEKAEKEKAAEVANALKIKTEAEAKAKKDAERRERFNSLRKVAAERGGNVGSPFQGHETLQDKEDLGRDRYGSR
jgi:hypothetical protein